MRILFTLLLLPFFSCKSRMEADILFFNARVYTVDADSTIADAFVVTNGKIVFVGKKEDARTQFSAKNQIGLEGKFVYPGFIDAHCHFTGYGLDLAKVNLVGTTSWNEVIDRVKKYGAAHHDGWIFGRGWDQNDWARKDFPSNEQLNALFPDQPVFLMRID